MNLFIICLALLCLALFCMQNTCRLCLESGRWTHQNKDALDNLEMIIIYASAGILQGLVYLPNRSHNCFPQELSRGVLVVVVVVCYLFFF